MSILTIRTVSFPSPRLTGLLDRSPQVRFEGRAAGAQRLCEPALPAEHRDTPHHRRGGSRPDEVRLCFNDALLRERREGERAVTTARREMGGEGERTVTTARREIAREMGGREDSQRGSEQTAKREKYEDFLSCSLLIFLFLLFPSRTPPD